MLTCPQALQVLGCFYEDLELLGLHGGKMKKNRDKGKKRKDRGGQSMVYIFAEFSEKTRKIIVEYIDFDF